MAGFQTKTFTKHDDYCTPKSAWDNIKHFIPKDKVIWEAFYCDGKSGEYLRELGFNVIHEEINFYEHNLGDIILTNPPFSDTKNIMKRLSLLDKPFIIIMPCAKLTASYVRDTFMNKGLQIIIPRKRIHFMKLVDGVMPDKWKNACYFDCFYYCYKMGLPRDITWLE